MSKYLNVFNTLAEYQAFSASTEYVQPNVALVKETNVLYYDYGNNKPQADLSDYKGEFQESYVGGDKYGNSAITKVNYIPIGIKDLSYAFQNWLSLKEVTCEIPNSVTNMNKTFYCCESLVTAPNIPSSVTSMSYTFYYCTSLVKAPEIPSGVTSMNYTFYGCSSIVNAPEIPNSVINMEHTFDNCKSIVSVQEIPNSMKKMYATFQHCSSLISVPNIPSGITDISWTFNYCSSLKELTFLMITPPTYKNTLQECTSLESIYVPDSAVDAYKTATGWSQFASKFKPLSSKPTE